MIRFGWMSTLVVATLALPGSGLAQIQTSAQQKCLNKVDGSATKVTSGIIRNSADCMKRGANGSLPMGTTAEACLSADLKGKVDKARVKVIDAGDSYCTGNGTPDFGFTDGIGVADAHEYEGVSLIPDCFGADLDAALAGPLAGDTGAKCTSAALGMTSKLGAAMLKVFQTCMKDGLKAKSITSSATLEACLDDITADVKGRVGKAVDRVMSKIASSCPAAPATYFPELDGAGELCDRYGFALPLDASSLASCIERRMRCRICRTVNTAGALSRDCDLYDDGNVDGTCPQCPNGVIDAGEECDDANGSDTDACVGDCRDAFCGDGFVRSGIEECDDGDANSDVTPNACRADCTLPTCGDGVRDDELGEGCDEGGVNTPTCDANCTLPACHDETLNTLAGEQCDDGNVSNSDACVGNCVNATCGDGYVRTGTELCDGGECCSGLCTFSVLGTPCTGSATVCVAPLCNGLGSCQQLPTNEGGMCDDGSICTAASTCQTGTCTATVLSGVGQACDWAVVGSPGHTTGVIAFDGAQSLGGGDWCGLRGSAAINSSFSGDIVTTGNDSAVALIFGDFVAVSGGDIVTNNYRINSSAPGVFLPGLPGVTTVLPGQHVAKTPAPTFYDTTGNDSRVARCQTAQASIATTRTKLNALASTANLGSAYQDLLSGAAPPINAVNVGGVNVFDMTHLNGTATNVTITLNGGGNANTTFVLRISQRLNTGGNWTFNLTGGLTADHVLFYVQKNSGDTNCALGLNNIGSGTIFCPDQQVHVNAGTIWSGAAYGGDSGAKGEITIGESVQLTYTPFTAALP
jgi:hypothetical protein